MEPMSGVDVTEIMRQVREQADKQRQKFTLASAASPRRNPQTREDLGFLQSSQDLADVRFSSHRKVVGEAITLCQKACASTPDPVLERQSAYNAVNTRLMSYLCDRVERMEGQVASALDALRAEETSFLDALRETVIGQLETLRQQQATALQALQVEVASQNRERRAQERHLTLLLDETRKHLSDATRLRNRCKPPPAKEQRSLDAFFAAFDEQFRGRRDEHQRSATRVSPAPQGAKIGTECATPLSIWAADVVSGWSCCRRKVCRAKGWIRTTCWWKNAVRAGLDVVEGIAHLSLRVARSAASAV